MFSYAVFKVRQPLVYILSVALQQSFSIEDPMKPVCCNGDGEIRTHDPLLARQVLSQLSYTPIWA